MSDFSPRRIRTNRLTQNVWTSGPENGVPVLLVSGARDPFGTSAELEAALGLGHAGPRRLEVLDDATHSFPPLLGPRVAALVADFLNRARPS